MIQCSGHFWSSLTFFSVPKKHWHGLVLLVLELCRLWCRRSRPRKPQQPVMDELRWLNCYALAVMDAEICWDILCAEIWEDEEWTLKSKISCVGMCWGGSWCGHAQVARVARACDVFFCSFPTKRPARTSDLQRPLTLHVTAPGRECLHGALGHGSHKWSSWSRSGRFGLLHEAPVTPVFCKCKCWAPWQSDQNLARIWPESDYIVGYCGVFLRLFEAMSFAWFLLQMFCFCFRHLRPTQPESEQNDPATFLLTAATIGVLAKDGFCRQISLKPVLFCSSGNFWHLDTKIYIGKSQWTS